METPSFEKLEELLELSQLGKIPTSDYMREEVISFREDTTIRDAIKILKAHSISGAPVTDSSHRVLGMVSEHDLLLQAASGSLGRKIEYVHPVFTVKKTANLKDVLLIFYKERIKRLPVVDKYSHLVGIVCRIDILSRLTDEEERIEP